MGKDALRGESRTGPGLPVPDPFYQRPRVRPAGQLDQLRPQKHLQGLPRSGGTGGQFVARLLGNIPDRDRRHAASCCYMQQIASRPWTCAGRAGESRSVLGVGQTGEEPVEEGGQRVKFVV